MGNVIRPPKWGESHPKSGRAKTKLPDGVETAPKQAIDDMHWLANALRIGMVEVVPALCAHCAEAGAERCYYPSCALYVDGA